MVTHSLPLHSGPETCCGSAQRTRAGLQPAPDSHCQMLLKVGRAARHLPPRLMCSSQAGSCRDNILVWQEGTVRREAKEALLKQRGCVVWFTGLSGSGKSTVACSLEHALHSRGVLTALLDGDNVRHGLNSNLGFSGEDRAENIRRVGEVAKLFVETGLITLASFISPYRRDRDNVRARLGPRDFIEVFMKVRQGRSHSLLSDSAQSGHAAHAHSACWWAAGRATTDAQRSVAGLGVVPCMQVPLEVCEQRDPKGLYALARSGKIKGFTGIDDPYEHPEKPEIILEVICALAAMTLYVAHHPVAVKCCALGVVGGAML